MATPLQQMLQIDVLPRDMRTVVESVLVLVGMLGAFAVRRRKRAVTATTFLLLSGSALIDAGSRFIPNDLVGQKVAVAALRTFPVRRDSARARIRRLDYTTRQGPLLDYQQGPADAGVVVRGRDGGAVHRLRGAAAFDSDHHDGLRGGSRLRAAGNSRQHLQRPVAFDGAAVRAGRLDPQRHARRAGQGNRMARDDDRDARQRAARDPQLRDREGHAVQLRHRPRSRRDYSRDQLRRAAQSRARGRAHPAARRAASAAGAVAGSAGVGYGDFAIQYPIRVLDCRLRRAGTRARSRRVEPLVCAAAAFDRDSVPDPHRPCARRGPRRRRKGRRRVRARADDRSAPGRLAARSQRRRTPAAGADCRGAPVWRR